MTKSEKREHDQRLINTYTVRLEELDREIPKSKNAFIGSLLIRNRRAILRRLMALYDTKKYGLV